ncbi:hypothetical protein [Helcococcus kunzii]|nr:hypothetical protein [Helcococcus kunzii]
MLCLDETLAEITPDKLIEARILQEAIDYIKRDLVITNLEIRKN